MTYMVGDIRVTGPMLRALRDLTGLSIREVARRSAEGNPNMAISNAHLSLVEREVRKVSPAVVAAYEQAVGAPLARVIDQLLPQGRPDDAERRAFHTAVAVAAAAGLQEDPDRRLLDEAAAYLEAPARVGVTEVAHLERVAMLVRNLDLRYGGELAGRLAHQPLRWGVELCEAKVAGSVRRRLQVAVGVLAQWAGWCAFDANRHGAARGLFRVAIGSAVRADEPDLRAHVIADISAQQHHLGYPDDALRMVRLADGDERIGPAVQCMLHGVRARAYASLGERDRCIREIEAAEQTGAQVKPEQVPDWLGGWEPAHVQAVSGHAYALLVEASLVDPVEGHKRLSAAADELAAARRLRAAALCLTALARMHQRVGSPEEAGAWADQARPLAADLRSARVSRALAGLAALRAAPHNGALRSPLTDRERPRTPTSVVGRGK